MRVARVFLLVSTPLFLAACGDRTTEPAQLPARGEVFLDQYSSGVTFQAFAGSKFDAVQIDQGIAHTGTASLKVAVPATGDPSGAYAGGAFTTTVPRDLTSFDALTFWARSANPATLDIVGFGNDNTESAAFIVAGHDLALTTAWQKFVIPIPERSKLTAEDGLFFFAEGPENGAANTLWFDDVKFETLNSIANPRIDITTQTVAATVGTTVQLDDPTVTFDVAGTDVTVTAAPSYFSFASSNPSVATVSSTGLVSVIGDGTTQITATLGSTSANGVVSVTTVPVPTLAAPVPALAAADVVSLFSGAYTNVPVGTWSADWDNADVADVMIAGNATKRYTNLSFAGIEFTSPTVDATAMTHLHLDIWTPDATASPATIRIKLVDFGANGVFGGDDSEHEISITAASSPTPLASNTWVSLDIPLTQFVGLTSRAHLAQMILSGDPNTVYVDNVYFYKGTVTLPSVPATAAPTPTYAAANVVSLFSNAYTNVTVDTWSAVWDNADVATVQIAGNDTKLYSNLVFAGIEATTAPVDASTMTHFRMDIWTPDAVASPAVLKIKLVDFGANGAFGGGDDVEHEVTLTATSTPALASGAWVTLDIALSQFAGLTTRGHIAQIILSGDPNTLYVDNVLFHK